MWHGVKQRQFYLFILLCAISSVSWILLRYDNNDAFENLNKEKKIIYFKSEVGGSTNNHSSLHSKAKKNRNAFDCFTWKYSKLQNKKKTPAVKLDPKRILYPGIVWGPNNQLKGLKESIYLAVRTNRTLVVPSFTSHYTHSNKQLKPQNFIDVDRLCSFVSCISEEEMKKFCDNAFDVAFQTEYASLKIIKNHEEKLLMKIIRDDKEKLHLKDFPHVSVVDLKDKLLHQNLKAVEKRWKYRKIKFKFDMNAVKKTYYSEAPCAILTYAFKFFPAMNLELFPINKTDTINYNSSLTNASDQILAYAITQALRRPPRIVNAVLRYVEEVLDRQKFIGVHWRYNHEDWAQFCKTRKDEIVLKNICKYSELIQPADVANSINKNFKTEILNNRNLTYTVPVYIASPSDMVGFIEEVYDELAKLNANFIKPEMSFELFLNNNYKDCWTNEEESKNAEIVSLAEMELMAQSFWFYFSASSTWSSNVRPLRIKTENNTIINKFETEIFELAQAEMELRLNESLRSGN